MACDVQILSVNGIDAAGGNNPTQLRVAGRLSQCPSGQVVVRVNAPFAATSAPTSPSYGSFGDGFIVVIPIPGNAALHCGDAIDVVAECYQREACNDAYTGPLRCCAITILTLDSVVPPGALAPSQIDVTGTAFGCTGGPPFVASDPVVVQITFPGGAAVPSAPAAVDALTGAFAASISVPAGVNVQCDGLLPLIEAWCSSNPACAAQPIPNGRIPCNQCARAVPGIVTAGTCAGTPPKQPITLGATINIAKGIQYFRWSYGDGASSLSPVFAIDNSGGTAVTPHVVPPYSNPAVPNSHNYAPGTYRAELVVTNAAGIALECDRIPLPVNASCNQCPTITVTATAGPCMNGMSLVTLGTNIASLPMGATVLQWEHRPGQFGSAQAATAVGAWPPTVVAGVNQFSYPPGTYTANLVTVLPGGCPPSPVTVTISCPPACCPIVTIDRPQSANNQQQPRVTGCAPATTVATFSAQLAWGMGCPPVAPSAFNWTVTMPSGQKYQKSTNVSSTDTTMGWTDTAGNAAVMQFGSGGVCSVAVTAVVPGVAPSCNPTDTAPFTVPACCPTLIGPLTASASPSDPCRWLFSAQLSNAGNAPVTFQWTFHDGTMSTTNVPQTDHVYLSSAPSTGTTTVTLKSPNCPDDPLPARVDLMCTCPAIAKPGAVVSGCMPGTPSVSLTSSVTPAVPGSKFEWTVTTPANAVLTKTTTVGGTTDGTSDGAWTDSATGGTGPIDLTMAGAYAVTVKASGGGISPSCMQPPATGFSIGPCGTSALSCTWWCVLLGIFFIALPISAYISTIAHCILGPVWNIALQGAIIAAAIGIFIALCGLCCVWLYILIGAVLGVIATIIYAYWGGFPMCWWQGLIAFIGFLILGLGMMSDCIRRANASASSGAGSSSSGLTSAYGRRRPQPLKRRAGSAAPMASAEAPTAMAAAVIASAAPALGVPATAPVPPAQLAGLGDLVQQVTHAMGIHPCEPCRQRAERLNQLVRF
jgi:hypothetical protein